MLSDQIARFDNKLIVCLKTAAYPHSLPGAKSKEGYDVAVIQLTMDSSGVGEGVIAAAARVKPNASDGVEVDAYETAPVKLLSVMKLIK